MFGGQYEFTRRAGFAAIQLPMISSVRPIVSDTGFTGYISAVSRKFIPRSSDRSICACASGSGVCVPKSSCPDTVQTPYIRPTHLFLRILSSVSCAQLVQRNLWRKMRNATFVSKIPSAYFASGYGHRYAFVDFFYCPLPVRYFDAALQRGLGRWMCYPQPN